MFQQHEIRHVYSGEMLSTFNTADLVVGEVHVGERDGRRGDDLQQVVVQPHVPDAGEAGEDAAPDALQFVVGQVQVEEGGQLSECGRLQGLEIVVVEELNAKMSIEIYPPYSRVGGVCSY